MIVILAAVRMKQKLNVGWVSGLPQQGVQGVPVAGDLVRLVVVKE